MNFKTVITQFKREFWENRMGFGYIPLALTGLYLIVGFCILLYINGAPKVDALGQSATVTDCRECSIADKLQMHGSAEFVEVANNPEGFNGFLLSLMYPLCGFLSIVLSIVSINYILRCLFDDRKSKEILFWRSMPVSETTNVLVKLTVVLLVAPLIILLINLFIVLLFFVVGLVLFVFKGVSFAFLVASVVHGSAYYIPFQIFYENLFGLLMLLPFIGYLLFVSALAKRSPFLWATVPGFLAGLDFVLHRMFEINLGVLSIFKAYFAVLYEVKNAYLLMHSLVFDVSLLIPFFVCLFIGSLLVAAAIWFRNSHYEI